MLFFDACVEKSSIDILPNIYKKKTTSDTGWEQHEICLYFVTPVLIIFSDWAAQTGGAWTDGLR